MPIGPALVYNGGMLALLLFACADKASTDDTGTPDDGGCQSPPILSILSPTAGETFAFGDEVTLTSEGEADIYLWAIEGDVVLPRASGTWRADVSGELELVLQGENDCGTRQANVRITVGAAPDDTGGDTGDDTGDTADTADTGEPPLEASVTAYGPEVGLPVGAWHGLSIGADGMVWGASTAGLARLDPTAGSARVYGLADGLTTDGPTAVLAHSDGTVWVGHVGTVDRQGEQVTVGTDGALTVVRPIDYTESSEITAVTRLAEQPYGAGVGDVWMGTNEGLCLWDADLAVFDEHAHPTHPHGDTAGVAFTDDGDIWNGDEHQLSRWRYTNDGSLSSGDDLVETLATWPVEVGSPIGITDLDVDGDTLWVASSLYGVASVSVVDEVGTSPVSLHAEPATARAIRADGAGNVWIGTDTGLLRWDGATFHTVTGAWLPADGVEQIVVDRATNPPTVWLGTSGGLVRLIGVPE